MTPYDFNLFLLLSIFSWPLKNFFREFLSFFHPVSTTPGLFWIYSM